VVLRNYEGMLIRYQAEDKPTTAQPTQTRGVSGLLQGSKSALIPEGTERMARRRKLQLVDEPGEQAGCGGEPGHTGGAALRPIIPLPMLNHGNGQAAAH
jgi:lysine 2,3-aminomutase